MSSSQFSRWLCVVLLVGCNGKLQVDPAASGGDGGTSGRGVAGAVGAGRGPIDEQAGDSAGGSDVVGAGATGFAGGDVGGAGAGTSGSGPGGGAGGAEPGPGQRGQPCIPGGTSVEADGSPAKASVTTLDRCDNGLVCDATKHCTGMPACPQGTGPCVVYGVPLEDPNTGGTNGGGGAAAAGATASTGGFGQALVTAEFGVTAMATDDTHLYWIEYGTRDGLGNYQHDGTLFSYAFADAKTTTVASDLPGPIALGVTSGHAYVAVDGGPLIGSPPHAQVLRLPLAGGATETVQDAVSATCFASSGDQAFWGASTGLYTVLPAAGAKATTLRPDYASQVAADATTVYATTDAFIFGEPQAGPAASALVSPGYPFALGSDSLYGVEPPNNIDGLILDSTPKTGGTWERKRALGLGAFTDRLQVIGDRFFVSATPDAAAGFGIDWSSEYIVTGLISSSAAPLRLLEKRALQSGKRLFWTGTASALFWSDGSAIFTRAITGK